MTHQEIIKTLRFARRSADITQIELGVTAGFDHATIAQWEGSRASPRLHNVIAWAQSLGYEIDLRPRNGRL